MSFVLSSSGSYSVAVGPILDVTGASGAIYRFRLCGDLSQLPATAGNFLWVGSAAAPDQIVCCGVARSLLDVADNHRTVAAQHPFAELYIRLNVIRSAREEEHRDIIAASKPDLVLAEAA